MWSLVASRNRVEKRAEELSGVGVNVRGQQAGPHRKTGFLERPPGREIAGGGETLGLFPTWKQPREACSGVNSPSLKSPTDRAM